MNEFQRYLRTRWSLFTRNRVRLSVKGLHAALKALGFPARRPPGFSSQKGDIVVPVYNNPNDVRKLLGHLAEANWSKRGRIVMIDDASSDLQCRTMLDDFHNKDNARIVLYNQTNCGFAASVNRATRQTEQNFIILNTDIDFTEGALDNLLAHLQTQPKVATVTPQTTYGFLAGVPDPFCANALFTGDGWRQLNTLFANLGHGLSTQIPAGVGFCMAVDRDGFAEVGGLPEISRGYGEDTGFSLELARRGWLNLLALDCFVPHTGGASFGASRRRLMREGARRIQSAYPEFNRRAIEYIATSPARYIQFLVLLELANTRPDLITVRKTRRRDIKSVVGYSATIFTFPETGQRHQYLVDNEMLAHAEHLLAKIAEQQDHPSLATAAATRSR